MKDPNPQIAQLVSNIETVDQWSRGLRAKEHIDWLARTVAWDIVAAVKMTIAAADAVDTDRMDEMLRSGLAEAAAAPGDHVVSLVRAWRRSLGEGPCRSTAASEEEQSWVQQRLKLPPPESADSASRQALADFAVRAADGAQNIVRVECGGSARLLVGMLGSRLAVILRE